MLRSSVRRSKNLELLYRQVFLLFSTLGGLASSFGLAVVAGVVSVVSQSIRVGLLVALAIASVLAASGWVSWRLPQRGYLVPQVALLRSQSGAAARFGFELGLGFRTLIPDHGVYVLAGAIVLLNPGLVPAMVSGATFGVVRGALPMLRSVPSNHRREFVPTVRLAAASPVATTTLVVLGSSGLGQF